MKKKKGLYYALMVVSIVLVLLAVSIFEKTKIIAPIILVMGIYLFLGAIIKLCKTNKKLKSTVICALDLLFWLP